MKGLLQPYQVEQIKKKYPVGTKIQLDHMDGEKDMPDGLLGEVKFVDDQGQLHMKWQNGHSLALVPNADDFHILPPLEQAPAAAQPVQDGYIRVLVVEPQKEPRISEIKNHYTAMQEIVEGDIECVALPDVDCHIYCNDEGKLNGCPGNRKLDNEDILCGTFLICADDGEGNDISLTDEQIQRYMERFGEPEQYSDEEAHRFSYDIRVANSTADFLCMLGLAQRTDKTPAEEDMEQ